jgi:hypothetical protein
MDQDFVPYQESVELKELSFDELCLASYETETNWHITHKPWRNSEDITEIASPLYQQAFRWFRKVHKLDGQITSWTKGDEFEYYYSAEPLGKPSIYRCDKYTGKSYEDAELACLRKLIQIVKEKSK